MKYLAEIDGLRAIAILSVLFFHTAITGVPGGFVGVDVFFVISGYLISRAMLPEIDAGQFSIRNFYERRIRRIAPALLVTLFFSSFYCFLLPPSDVVGIQKALFSALFSVSNFWFYTSTDYFADTSFNPLLHIWSLSVEEQFYIFLPPFLLLVTAWLRNWRAGAIAGIALLSLVLAEVTISDNHSGAFYLPWLRAWELLAGTLLASIDTSRLGEGLRSLLVVVGLSLIAYAVLCYDDRMSFPGISALVPVTGSAAIIAGCGTRLGRLLLANAVMRFFGKISYSLYLVHWPIICLFGFTQALTPKVQIVVLILSVALGYLSWRLVEMPFRSTGSHRSQKPTALPRYFAASAMVLCAAFLGVGLLAKTLWQQYPDALRYADYLNEPQQSLSSKDCVLNTTSGDYSLPLIKNCLSSATDQQNVLLIGDSHALHYFSALREQYPDRHIATLAIIGCLPLIDDPSQPQCADGMDYIFKQWLASATPPVQTVILSARWQANNREPLVKLIQRLDNLGIRTIILGPSPEYRLRVPLMLAYETILSRDFSMRVAKPDRFEIDRFLKDDALIGKHYYSTVDALCSEGHCLTESAKQPLYFDRDHFNLPGARIALSKLHL